MIEKETKDDSYPMKLANAFLESGITLWNLRHPRLKKFFLQEHNETLPSIQTFYNKIGVMYRNTIKKIKSQTDISFEKIGFFFLTKRPIQVC